MLVRHHTPVSSSSLYIDGEGSVFHQPVYSHEIIQPANTYWDGLVKDGGVVDNIVTYKPFLERSIAKIKHVLTFVYMFI